MTDTKNSEALDLPQLAEDLASGKQKSTTVDGNHGREIAQRLMALGFEPAEMYSTCTKASFEAKVSNGVIDVTVTDAHFMGAFTQIDVHAV